MKKLTEKRLKEMEPGKIFAHGTIKNSPDGLFMTGDSIGKELDWIAQRGQTFHDWAIYCDWHPQSHEKISRSGQKVYGLDNVKKLVDCDSAALGLYRR